MEICSFSSLPIIFVTSCNSDMDEMQSIMLGGDAFITKPYNTAILLAKIASLLRRAYPQIDEEQLSWNRATLHLATGKLHYGRQEIDPTKNEMKIFCYLFHNAGKICSSGEVIDFLLDNQLPMLPINFLSMVVLGSFLLVCNLELSAIFLIGVIWVLIIILWFVMRFYFRKKELNSLLVMAGKLRLSGNSIFQYSMGETLYNLYTDEVYIVPDEVAQKLLAVRQNRYTITQSPISYKDAVELEKIFRENLPTRSTVRLLVISL